MIEPTPTQLISDLLAWSRDDPFPDRGELPLWRWQRWMKEQTALAWIVLEGVIAAAPDDPEMMDHAARQLELLLWTEPTRSWRRATDLLSRSSLLARMVGPEVFVPGHYGPRYRTMQELVSVYLRHDRSFVEGNRLVEIVRNEPERGVALALEVIARGPFHGFDAFDVGSPLLDALRFHGHTVIAAVESAAKQFVGVRRVIYQSRRLNPRPDEPYSIPADVWSRFQHAAAGTTTYNTEMPPGQRSRMDAEAEGVLASWFESEATAWATWKIADFARKEPQQAWEAILTITGMTTDAVVLCNCGCGPLEDLIRNHPSGMVELVEAEARSNPAFVQALSCCWLTLKDVPDDLAHRYRAASGGRLSVLDAPDGWADEDSDGEPHR